MDKKRRCKAIMLSMAMVVTLSAPLVASAQGGLFQRGASTEPSRETEAGMLGYSNEVSGVINNQTFGQEVPFGSGAVILLAAGIGYALLKRKEDEQ